MKVAAGVFFSTAGCYLLSNIYLLKITDMGTIDATAIA